MLEKLNRWLQKLLPIITPISVIIGVLFADYLAQWTFIVPWVFAMMTFSGSLSSNFHSVKEVFLRPLPLLFVLILLHIVMPLWAYGIGSIVFQNAYTITGLVLGMAIPTGITSFVWVLIYKGNIGLALSVILIDTLLSPIIVPATLALLVGERVPFHVGPLMSGFFFMIVLPSLIGMTLNQLSSGTIKDSLGATLAPFSKLGIGIVVSINSAAVAPYLRHIDYELILIASTVFVISMSGYLLAWVVGILTKQNRENRVTLLFCGGMRNISAGAVMAVQYFPPPVAVPVVVGMLFQQVLASIFGTVFAKTERNTLGSRELEKVERSS
ncbi:bile acid:sodium symporter family protein [Bacillus spongiae]|uniref:Bile acid:sodium symporter family protein n=2 Tax=Bacillus spongiae TaxID=2683610 RepID=A0ABU8HJ65_9BACI